MRARLISADGATREVDVAPRLERVIYTALKHPQRNIYQPGYEPLTPHFGPNERRRYEFHDYAQDGTPEYREVWELSRWAECGHCGVMHYLDKAQALGEAELH